MPKKINKTMNFKLSALLLDKNPDDKIKNIFSYCIVEYAKKYEKKLLKDWGYYENLSYNISDEDFEEYEKNKFWGNVFSEDLPKDFDIDNNLHRAIIYANLKEPLIVYSMNELFERHEKVKIFIEEFELRYGKDVYVQIGRTIFRHLLKGKIDFYEFTFICAVNSKVGKKDLYKSATLNEILARMNGLKLINSFNSIYNNEEKLIINGQDINKNIFFLNDSKLKRIKNKCAKNEYFVTYTFKNRITYYTTRLTFHELIKAVFHDANKRIELQILEYRLEKDLIENHKNKVKERNKLRKEKKYKLNDK
ncbi:MAG: hypothetical protein N2321_00545 [Melioribacteraceae bacterium]|nr:hypothetical protein [Melioribacteraceae bacterium]